MSAEHAIILEQLLNMR